MIKFTKGLLKFLLPFAIVVAVVLGVVKYLYVDVAVMNHNGMTPNIEAGDEILVWREAGLARGDIAVCEHPSNPGEIVIGRVVADPEMTVASARGQLQINGYRAQTDVQQEERFEDTRDNLTGTYKRVTETFASRSYDTYQKTRTQFRLTERTVRANHIFLLSDNRNDAAHDSRTFGDVDPSTCRGQVFMRLRPAPNSPNELGGYLDLL